MRRIPRILKRSLRFTPTATKAVQFPRVYVQEIPSGSRSIGEVATSITAFIGRAFQGPVNEPTRIHSFGEFERRFGGLWTESLLGHLVRHFYLNGGKEALIVRLANGATPATITLRCGEEEQWELQAHNPGNWGRLLRIIIDHQIADPASSSRFNMLIEHTSSGQEEKHINVSMDPADPRFLGPHLEQRSQLVAMPRDPSGNYLAPASRPDPGVYLADASSGHDGSALEANDFTGPGRQAGKEGLYALNKVDLFNLLVIPPYTTSEEVNPSVRTEAALFCERKKAFLILDPPSDWQNPADAQSGIANLGTTSPNAALYFPRTLQPDPLQSNQQRTFPPSGTIAGLIVRTDASRGVWKAPAGTEASLYGVQGFSTHLTSQDHSLLNPLAINVLRSQPPLGPACWGARTLQGQQQLSSEWKYIPVRRTALFIEESLQRGTLWAVFEPNDANLWTAIQQSVNDFLFGLFRKGAFQGATAKETYFVKCGLGETMTQHDIDQSRLIIQAGFAPLKPAEFIILQIQQKTG